MGFIILEKCSLNILNLTNKPLLKKYKNFSFMPLRMEILSLMPNLLKCIFLFEKRHKNKGDMKLYIKYLKNAAEGGCIEAQFNLGEEYRTGLNLKKD